MFDPVVDSAVIGVIAVIISAFLAYLFSSHQETKQKILSERIALFRPVAHCLSDILYLDNKDPEYKAKQRHLALELNRLNNESLLFAPDKVYRELQEVLKKDNVKGEDVVNFLLVLRKELIGKTTIIKDEVHHFELE